jgi:hypothetical protein
MVAWVVIDRTHSRQTPPSFFPCSHSHFGSHSSFIQDEISLFFSCTYVEPILQPVCFQIHPCNGGAPSHCSPLHRPPINRRPRPFRMNAYERQTKRAHFAQFWCNVSPFRMNTCKSASKQRTLTSFRMNTYEKQAGGGWLTRNPARISEGSLVWKQQPAFVRGQRPRK